MTVIIGGLFIRETRHVRIWDEVGGETSRPSSRQEAERQGGRARAGEPERRARRPDRGFDGSAGGPLGYHHGAMPSASRRSVAPR